MARYDNWKGMAYPPPECFPSGPPTDDISDSTNPNDAFHPFPPKGHLEDAGEQFEYALWGAFDGRRNHGKGRD